MVEGREEFVRKQTYIHIHVHSSKLRIAVFFLHVPGARQNYYNKRLCNCHTQERSYIQSLIV